MAESFRAVVADKPAEELEVAIRDLTTDDLPDHDVLIDVDYSTLNYKDGLAMTGAAPIARSFPMVCGIDLAGKVAESSSEDFGAGDRVLVNGFGLSESHWGGYSQRARMKSSWLVKVPDSFSNQDAMAIGTAGYTSMLCVMALESNGVAPDSGDVVVTGAAGGVGSVAVALLSRLGYRVIASTGRAETHDYLKALGADEILDREELGAKPRAVGKERWAGAVDSVGSNTLANLIAQARYDGCVAACGLAGGVDLPATVYPFILRNVTLAGVDSVMAPIERRREAWRRLAELLSVDVIQQMTTVEPMSGVIELAPKILAGQTRGRVVIDVNS
ncbi:MAG: MDR family oxidoreductase [Acidobacteriota bacterium]|nr:MDR family oxidoreductase [Acidobacteriota bacterium]